MKRISKKVSKKSVKQHPIPLRRKILVLAGIALVSAAVVVLAVNGYDRHVAAVRLTRIMAIYSSFKLDDSFTPQDAYIFGDKRPYSWAGDASKGRTGASSMTYVSSKSVGDTVEYLRGHINAAGFDYIGDPYPGAKAVGMHFKDDQGEYVRVTVSSKLRDDAIFNASIIKQDLSTAAAMDDDAAPSNVTIKVNLDDNNE